VVGVVAASYVFTNLQMGDTQVMPNEEQQKIFSMQFFILDALQERLSSALPVQTADQ